MAKRKLQPTDADDRFDVTVWNMFEGDIAKKLWDATWDEVQDVYKQYDADPFYEVQVEPR
jgi:hypothetical protein